MKNTSVFMLLTAAFLCACKGKPATEPENFDFTIVPGDKFGIITAANCTREGVLAAYGENAKVDSIYLYEGMRGEAVVLFPKDPKRRAEFFWDKEYDPKYPAFIRVRGDSLTQSDWVTSDGITLGMSIADVQAINGKAFSISGFGWDYGGAVVDWMEGKLNATTQVIFVPTAQGDLPTVIMGEGIHASDRPEVLASKPKVSSMNFRILANEKIPDCIAELVKKNQNPGKVTVKKLQLADGAHYWLSDGAAAYDGIEYVFDGNCKEVCQFGGMRHPPVCAEKYTNGKWQVVWEER